MIRQILLDYTHQGTTFEGLLAVDDQWSAPRPGIMIAHTWSGRDEFVCGKARTLAGLGYAAFAIDLYGKGVTGGGPEVNAGLMAPLMEDRGLLQARINTALETLRARAEVDRDRIAAMGFCFGGLCVLDLARSGADLRGVISFHGLFTPPGDGGGRRIRAKVLVLHGNDDPMVPVESVTALEQELTAAGADWQIHVFGNTMHAFTNPAANSPEMGTVYNGDADRRSWQSLRNFLDEVMA